MITSIPSDELAYQFRCLVVQGAVKAIHQDLPLLVMHKPVRVVDRVDCAYLHGPQLHDLSHEVLGDHELQATAGKIETPGPLVQLHLGRARGGCSPESACC